LVFENWFIALPRSECIHPFDGRLCGEFQRVLPGDLDPVQRGDLGGQPIVY